MDAIANSHPTRGAAGDQQSARGLGLVAVLLDRVAPWLLVCISLLLLERAIAAAARADTAGSVIVFLMSNVKVTRGFAFVFGLAGVIYGLQQRSLRRAEAARQERRIAELEASVQTMRRPESPSS